MKTPNKWVVGDVYVYPADRKTGHQNTWVVVDIIKPQRWARIKLLDSTDPSKKDLIGKVWDWNYTQPAVTWRMIETAHGVPMEQYEVLPE